MEGAQGSGRRPGAISAGFYDAFFPYLMKIAFLGSEEARSHQYAIHAECEGRNQALAVGDSSPADHEHLFN
jgi:hypothetical protein